MCRRFVGHRIRDDIYEELFHRGYRLYRHVHQKIHPHLTIGKISFAMEAFVIAAGTIAVSRQVENLIYGMIISFIMSTVVDKVMYGLSAGKMALIVTTEPYEVAEKISQTTERGCTFIKAQGSYSEEEREVVMCACSNKQMFAIRSAVREVDPDAFIVILDSNEVVGEGFKKCKTFFRSRMCYNV